MIRRPSRGAAIAAYAAAACGLIVAGAAVATHNPIDTDGHTTLQQIVTGVDADGDPKTSYQTLRAQDVATNYLLRDGAAEKDPKIPDAQAGREARRTSLTYFAQMTDFQFVDEESPARVEFLDANAASAHRPYEAFIPYATDSSVRQINRFAAASPVPQGDGSANQMDFALITGDQADNQQRNETVWVREVLEGGRPLKFNSGLTDPAAYTAPGFDTSAGCAALLVQEGVEAGATSPTAAAAAAAAEGGRYTGVQDADDYPPVGAGEPQRYYDPDAPQGFFKAAGWPTYPGLLDRANQITITPEGLAVPFYLTNGNHDVLAQGNEDANQAFERLATGCEKVLATPASPNQSSLVDFFANPSAVMLVPPDPQRQFVSKTQLKTIYGETIAGDDDHGFAYVDKKESQASNGSASYYAWNPPQSPGFRFISIDTNSEGGVLGPFDGAPLQTGSSAGNLDDPQFKWLVSELDAAQKAGKLIVVFGHHPIRSLDSAVPDEAAARCTGSDPHGHDVNPGCDLDSRNSNPLHLGDPAEAKALGSSAKTVAELFAEYPNLVSYVPGHTHENRVMAYPKQNKDVFWELNTSAVIDHPQESRLIEVFDNQDGTLSIFGTVLSHASPGTPPPSGTSAAGFSGPELASIGREIAFNDPQLGQVATTDEKDDPPPPTGFARDRNVELLVRDVRIAPPPGPGEPFPKELRCAGKDATIIGTTGNDVIAGTNEKDVIVTGSGNDKVKAGGDKDVICGNDGNDKLRGGGGGDVIKGAKGNDRLVAQGGNDRPTGGPGDDRLEGGSGRDRVSGGKDDDSLDGGPGVDGVAGGAGEDRCVAEQRRDRASTRGCEKIVGRGPR
ncbi:MAG: hypothetical protein ACR2OC_04365 [Solirubrobacterales bacterium]